MKKPRISTDRIIGLSAMLISLLTLIIFVYQTNLLREQSYLSVTPRIAFNHSQNRMDSTLTISADIINKGLGPAIIESIHIIHENKKYDLDFRNFLEAVYPDIEKYGQLINSTTLSKGSTLSPSETISIYSFTLPTDQVPGLLKYLKITEDRYPFDIEIIYSSVYQEKWKANNQIDGHPVKLN